MEDSELRSFVESAQVCWEISPHTDMHQEEPVVTGFELSLFARRPAGCTGDPGCPTCDQTWLRLRGLVERILPAGAQLEIEPFDAAFHLRPERGFAAEIALSALVLHGESTFDQVDGAERDRIKQAEDALVQLGCRNRGWARTGAG
jgi:hypothetical protein